MVSTLRNDLKLNLVQLINGFHITEWPKIQLNSTNGFHIMKQRKIQLNLTYKWFPHYGMTAVNLLYKRRVTGESGELVREGEANMAAVFGNVYVSDYD